MPRILSPIVVVTSAILSQPPVARPDDASQLELIRAAYADQADSIDSLVVTLHVHGETSRSASRDAPELEFEQTLEWARDGQRRKLALRRRTIEPEQRDVKEWYSFDGRHRMTGQWDRDTGNLLLVQIRPGLPHNFFWMLEPDDFLGRRMPQTRLSLREMLGQPTSQVLGTEAIDDAACWKVDLGIPWEDGRRTNWHYFAWFDPAADYLPRRIRADYVPDPSRTRRVKEWWSEIRIESFSRVSDPTRLRRWFPAVAAIETRRETNTSVIETHKKITLTHLQVNDPPAESAFRLVIPPGTAVVDHRQAGMPKQYVVGDAATIDQLIQDRQREIAQLSTGAVPTLDASPRRSSLFVWFLVASLICLAAAVVMRWKRVRG